MLFDDSLRKTKYKSKNENFDLKKVLLEDKKISYEFVEILKTLTLEDLIALKLDVSLSALKGKLYGFPILKFSQDIVKEAILKYALSASKNKKEAALILGITKSQLFKLIKQYRIKL